MAIVKKNKKKSSSFHKILLVVFGAAFGLVAIALGYQALNSSADIRSKAAETQSIYKRWEFNGTGTEGWSTVKPYTIKVENGSLIFSVQKSATLPVFRNPQVNVILPQGLKKIAFSMAVGNAKIRPKSNTSGSSPGSVGGSNPSVQGVSDEMDDDTSTATLGSACTEDARQCPDGSYVGRSGPNCTFVCSGSGGTRPGFPGKPTALTFTAKVYYKFANKTTFEKPLDMKGVANGKFQQYVLALPDVGKIQIERIRIVMTGGVRPGDTVTTDWIRLMGPVVKPTSTPVGCYMKEVQCVKAPCPPILVCPPKPGGVACTEEAKICPDGSAVGRTGPNCAFAPCP